jgi:hypothetical protein
MLLLLLLLPAPFSSLHNDEDGESRRLKIEIGLWEIAIDDAVRPLTIDDGDLISFGRIARECCEATDEICVISVQLLLQLLPRLRNRSRSGSQSDSDDDDDENDNEGIIGAVLPPLQLWESPKRCRYRARIREDSFCCRVCCRRRLSEPSVAPATSLALRMEVPMEPSSMIGRALINTLGCCFA